MQKKLKISFIILTIFGLLALLDSGKNILLAIDLGMVITAGYACFFYQNKFSLLAP
ncbi:hypothetical protein [Colwellia piezophila]|uniref:hypothetical protein n=1 Tax=Colwellia piezophila TaxID=211668 RepID=UPI00037B9049|nr:hypothetical protein [Colwellia piezophila]